MHGIVTKLSYRIARHTLIHKLHTHTHIVHAGVVSVLHWETMYGGVTALA